MLASHHFISSLYFFIFFFCFCSLSLSNSDFNALLSFKASLSDPNSSLSSWLNSTQPCSDSWFGVTCNPATNRVTKLVLENLNLTGSVQPLNQLTHLRLLSLKNNFFYSSNLKLSSWPHIKNIYLSHNQFRGIFPSGVSNIRHLHRLDLSYNLFTGEIPMSELTRLPTLLTLRLEENSFTGTLDSANSSSLSLLDFNVSKNKLSGEIPSWMSRFLMSSFGGNENLCGRPLASNCSNRPAESVPVRSRSRRLRAIIVLVIVLFDVVAIIAAVVTITWCCYKRKRNRWGGGVHNEMQMKHGTHHNRNGKYGGEEEDEMVVFEGCHKGFTKVGDLLKASAELLGKGCVGTTYKVVMEGGDVVVVKRMRERKKKKEVDEWLSVIGGLRHCNIVNLRAYFNAKDELLLVYDFLPNGSLQSLLHGDRGPGRTPLDWTTRLKLASDSAKGLAFLHGYDKIKLFHGHLSSSNIVVDRLGNACISDISVHQLLPSPLLINNAYKAPEVKPNNSSNRSQRKYTQKCDVYSFGVVLLEMLTGKMATGDGESSIVLWAQRTAAEEDSWEVFDFELIRDKEMEEEMRALLQVALLCLAPLPRNRPKMSLVHRMIEDIRTKGSIDGGNSFINNLSSDSSPSLSETVVN
ncbi:probable leucine-rich repeat receptor-like protein kinase At1g68400 [Pistacia vera]|uniref:probable leucine-rich repeat receptor-like protein kinase At1g68400 n=1 Tax=Pistacia vera TaxID=55513 RepID=UPI00126309FF|nr:probable leucine-rich repeat receptor-like protein kinase At1g68400 [Pistacia vera]